MIYATVYPGVSVFTEPLTNMAENILQVDKVNIQTTEYGAM